MSELIPVIIVEDEQIILNDIVNMIDWEKAGFHIVATALNGKQGLNAFHEYHPQLIITDIQMPVIGGLDMLSAIRSEDPSASFLILSSYSEFEYAKTAVRLGTDSYLLKTELSPELLLETLSVSRTKIQGRMNMRRFNIQHRLFSLISACAEPDGGTPPTPEEISEAYDAFTRDDDSPGRLQRLERHVRECYNVLGLTGVGETMPHDTSSVRDWLLKECAHIQQVYYWVYVQKGTPVIISAVDYITANLSDQSLKISSIADHVGLSASRLSVLFKQELGCTVNDFITRTRINESKRLLKTGKYKIYEVSDMVGYKTSQYFSQIFFQNVGCLPKDYAKGGGT